MITEDYVSFETAKLLKEKGFDEGCSFIVNTITKGVMPVSWPTTNSDIEDAKACLIALPTLQMAMKWLRKVHNIHIEVRITNHSLSSLIDIPRYYWIIFNAEKVKWMDESTAHKPMSYETVEQACEAAIKYCLDNLI